MTGGSVHEHKGKVGGTYSRSGRTICLPQGKMIGIRGWAQRFSSRGERGVNREI